MPMSVSAGRRWYISLSFAVHSQFAMLSRLSVLCSRPSGFAVNRLLVTNRLFLRVMSQKTLFQAIKEDHEEAGHSLRLPLPQSLPLFIDV